MYKIAECSLVSVEDLKQRNRKLNENKLIVGKVIKVPYFHVLKTVKSFDKKKVDINKKEKVTLKKIFKWPTSGKVSCNFCREEIW